jgi:ABC-type branched-subunit amino acid transport system permease subunit/ABC-type branched-subunit amino acid transport system ATPase component
MPLAGLVPMLAEITVTRQVVFNGLVTGITYGLLAAGLILIYRATNVLNVAHGELGAFGAAVLALLVIKYDVNFYLAFLAALGVGLVVGAAVEVFVVRRLANSPRVIVFVATLGVAELLFLFTRLLPDLNTNQRYPTPLTSSWEVGGVLLRSQHVLVLVVAPIVIVALAYFLERTKYGLAIRASAENPDAARTSAINAEAMSTLVWVLAGVLATITVVLVAPLRGGTAVDAGALGPSLLLRALAVALLAGMRSLPRAIVFGAVIGIAEAIFVFNSFDDPGRYDAALFVLVLVAVLALARRQTGDAGSKSMSFAARTRAIPPQLEHVWWVRHLPAILTGAVVVIAAVLPFVITQPSRHFLYAEILLFAIVAMSLTLLTGWAGQLSLGQVAFVGLGAMLTTAFVRGMNITMFGQKLEIPKVPFEYAIVLATIVCVVVAVIVGVPALRVSGLFLAVTTLAFAVMAESWLLKRPFLIGDESIVSLPRPSWGDAFSLESQRNFYLLSLAVVCICGYALSRLRRSGIGRSVIAVRDNEQNAAAFTVSPTRAKLMAFGIAGALAGLAGGLIAGLRVQFGPEAFSPEESLRVVAIAVIGGLSSIWGAVLGALWVVGLPAFFGDTQEIRLLTSGAGLLILLLYLPGGLVQVLYNARDALYRVVARRVPEVPEESAPAPIPARVVRDDDHALVVEGTVLAAHSVTVDFGLARVLDEVDLTVGAEEVVGLIGTNGAGKSTLMNAIGGFVPASGRVELLGRDVTDMAPHRRARLGLGRTFQQADLFPDLSVLETVMVSLEARDRATLPSTVLGLPSARRAERRKRGEADELIAFFGLGRYANSFINELSTGTRRIVELACLIGLEAKVLCLDEPTAGLAQAETEAFAPLVLRIREELGASLLVIEHDMPFIMGITDRVYCLEAGSVIAHGTPDAVRNDPAVIASYLGGDERAIQRSDTTEKLARR